MTDYKKKYMEYKKKYDDLEKKYMKYKKKYINSKNMRGGGDGDAASGNGGSSDDISKGFIVVFEEIFSSYNFTSEEIKENILSKIKKLDDNYFKDNLGIKNIEDLKEFAKILYYKPQYAEKIDEINIFIKKIINTEREEREKREKREKREGVKNKFTIGGDDKITIGERIIFLLDIMNFNTKVDDEKKNIIFDYLRIINDETFENSLKITNDKDLAKYAINIYEKPEEYMLELKRKYKSIDTNKKDNVYSLYDMPNLSISEKILSILKEFGFNEKENIDEKEKKYIIDAIKSTSNETFIKDYGITSLREIYKYANDILENPEKYNSRAA